MVWVVDGTRRVRDKKGFVDVLKYARRVGNEAVRKLQGYADEWALLRDWGDSQVPVFFDFGEDILWGLLPKAMDGRYVFRVARNELVDVFRHTSQMTFEGVLNALAKLLAQWRTSEEIRAALSQGSWSPSPADFLRRRGHRGLRQHPGIAGRRRHRRRRGAVGGLLPPRRIPGSHLQRRPSRDADPATAGPVRRGHGKASLAHALFVPHRLPPGHLARAS